jgi:hypothetical protein
MVRTTWVGILILGVVAISCGDDNAGNGKPTSWQGPTQHFRAVGTLHGNPIDLTVSGADAMDTTKLWCEREYTVPMTSTGMPDYPNGKLTEVRVLAMVTIAGQSKKLRIELKEHDFQTEPPNTQTAIVLRNDAVPTTPTQMWLEWEEHDPVTDAKTYVSDAQTGSFTKGEMGGTPDQTGLLIPEHTGTVGGFANGTWSPTECMVVSFDAKCTINEVHVQ